MTAALVRSVGLGERCCGEEPSEQMETPGFEQGSLQTVSHGRQIRQILLSAANDFEGVGRILERDNVLTVFPVSTQLLSGKQVIHPADQIN